MYQMSRTPPLNLNPSPATIRACAENMRKAREAIHQCNVAHEYALRFYLNSALLFPKTNRDVQ